MGETSEAERGTRKSYYHKTIISSRGIYVMNASNLEIANTAEKNAASPKRAIGRS